MRSNYTNTPSFLQGEIQEMLIRRRAVSMSASLSCVMGTKDQNKSSSSALLKRASRGRHFAGRICCACCITSACARVCFASAARASRNARKRFDALGRRNVGWFFLDSERATGKWSGERAANARGSLKQKLPRVIGTDVIGRVQAFAKVHLAQISLFACDSLTPLWQLLANFTGIFLPGCVMIFLNTATQVYSIRFFNEDNLQTQWKNDWFGFPK